MSLFSWFNSADQVDTALVVVGISGAIIEVGVAVVAVINVHKEISESRKRILEKYLEIFACVAAFFFLTEAILGCRSSMLLSKEIEKIKGDNLVLQTNVLALESHKLSRMREIPQEVVTNFIIPELKSYPQIKVSIVTTSGGGILLGRRLAENIGSVETNV